MYILGLDPTLVVAAADIPGFSVGDLGMDSDGKIYQFVQAAALTAVGDVVQINELGSAILVTTTTTAPAAGQGLPAGVCVSIIAASGWGWVQRHGVIAAINVATAAAAHTALNSTATGGRIDDDASVGAEVLDGITTTAAEASNSAAGILNWPLVGRTL